MSLDLDAYFARIAYGGPTTPSLATLHGLTQAHTTAIPFENLDVLLGRTLSLDPDVGLRLDTEEKQATPHEARRIVREQGRFFHQAFFGGMGNDVYEFTLEEMPRIDRDLAN